MTKMTTEEKHLRKKQIELIDRTFLDFQKQFNDACSMQTFSEFWKKVEDEVSTTIKNNIANATELYWETSDDFGNYVYHNFNLRDFNIFSDYLQEKEDCNNAGWGPELSLGEDVYNPETLSNILVSVFWKHAEKGRLTNNVSFWKGFQESLGYKVDLRERFVNSLLESKSSLLKFSKDVWNLSSFKGFPSFENFSVNDDLYDIAYGQGIKGFDDAQLAEKKISQLLSEITESHQAQFTKVRAERTRYERDLNAQFAQHYLELQDQWSHSSTPGLFELGYWLTVVNHKAKTVEEDGLIGVNPYYELKDKGLKVIAKDPHVKISAYTPQDTDKLSVWLCPEHYEIMHEFQIYNLLEYFELDKKTILKCPKCEVKILHNYYSLYFVEIIDQQRTAYSFHVPYESGKKYLPSFESLPKQPHAENESLHSRSFGHSFGRSLDEEEKIVFTDETVTTGFKNALDNYQAKNLSK